MFTVLSGVGGVDGGAGESRDISVGVCLIFVVWSKKGGLENGPGGVWGLARLLYKGRACELS